MLSTQRFPVSVGGEWMNQRNVVMLPVATGQGRMDKLEGDEIHQVLSIYEDRYFNILT